MILDFIKSIIRRFLPASHSHGDFKRRKRYRVEVVNSSSLDSVFEWRCSRAQLVLGCVGAMVLIGMVAVAMVNMSPLRRVLPSAMSASLRDDYEQMSMRLDSMYESSNAALSYAMNISRILQASEDSAMQSDASKQEVSTLPLDSLMEASAAERAFVQRFEDEERYNLSVLAPIAATGMTFYPPVIGVQPEAGVSEGGIPYLRFDGDRTAVSAAYRGTVINSYYTSERGVTVSVQHPNDFITIYSGLSDAFVTRGDKVNAGTRLGENRDASRPLIFELWHNGTPLQAAEYISF